MRLGLVSAIVGIGYLAGCSAEQSAIKRQAVLDTYERTCINDYGMKNSSPELQNCIMKLDQAQKEAMRRAWANMGNSFSKMSQPSPVIYQPPPLNNYGNNYGRGWY
jgi:hypothetical protein